jgi:hypothetical protein
MKKILASLLLTAMAVPAFAQHHVHRAGYGHHHHHGRYHAPRYYPHYGWVAPMVIGGVVTYALTRPAPVVIQDPPVVVEQPVVEVVPGTNCTPWREIQQSDGSIVRERTCQR